jgi:MFS family permease
LGWLQGTFASLAERDFRILWLGTLASFIAFFMSTVVQSVVAFQLGGTNRAVGIVVFAQGLAMLALGPLGGALADRWPKRAAVGTGQSVITLVFAATALLIASGRITVWLLALGSLAMGLAFSVVGPARQSYAADLVPRTVRGNAMALTQVGNSASRVLAPALAGALLAWEGAGATAAYASMAALYAVSTLALCWLPRTRRALRESHTHVITDLLEGLRYMASRPRLRLLVLTFILVVMVGFPYMTVLPGLVEHQLGRGAEAISLLYLISAVGGLAASVLVARHADSRHATGIYSAMALCFGLSLLALAAAPSFELACLAVVLVGVTGGGFQSLNGAVVVNECDPAYLGRMMSLTMLAFAGFGLMGLPVGLLADALGERGALAVMGVALLAIALPCTLGLARHAAPAPLAERLPAAD